MSKTSTGWSDSDRERLGELVSAAEHRDRALALDELQGFCVAIAMGPDDEPPHDWIAAALDTDDAPSAELVQLLERFRGETERALNDGTLAIAARTLRTGRVDYGPWCSGFIAGANASETDWFDAADPDELGELMFPIEVLAEALPEPERAAYGPAQWRRLVHDAQEGLASTVQRLRDYWRIVRTPPATIRRDEPKVGRNDPCPCGSGRKFKQCHGRG